MSLDDGKTEGALPTPPLDGGDALHASAAAQAAAQHLSPADRLAASREALRGWLAESHRRHAPTQPEPPPAPHEEPGWMTAIFEVLSDVPAATIAANWLRRWWSHHPWRATAELAGAVATELAVPFARRHPWALLGGGLLAGVALTRMRPWRWISGGALLASFMPRLQLSSILQWVTETMVMMNTPPSAPPDGGPHGPSPSDAPPATPADASAASGASFKSTSPAASTASTPPLREPALHTEP